jgi:hypothetical protein
MIMKALEDEGRLDESRCQELSQTANAVEGMHQLEP